ncbi:hypothetical protein [Metabacillus halosaccharovorans]|uniref:Uncharacterized protein n=1 Tax=Metabacillus halosaccharovorans TaxID=930124 RepID=A0ABT3DCX1_9BACI|nr:hypothetical protein [Metabacillus halosaccharovorans]MCV9884731.1 hypothetical protein [Metabacillus halosaccharovorans]
MLKTINVVLEDVDLKVEQDSESNLVEIHLGRIEEDGSVLEAVQVFPSISDVKQIIKALQHILPDEE